MDYKKILEGVVDIINTTEKSDIGFANICSYICENCPELTETENEKIRKSIINLVIKSAQNGGMALHKWESQQMIAWLEKQGERASVLSEEDEIAFGDALWCCKQAASIAKDENDMGNVWYTERWLKSLKERITWKPSDEQIKGIECAIKTLQYQLNVGDKRFDSLYNDLKKLICKI